MSLSRKRRRELKKLRKLAGGLLEEQRVVLTHAGGVLSEAGHQAKKLSDEHLAPRVLGAYETVRPTVEGGWRKLRNAARAARNAVTPYTTAAVTRTAGALEAADKKELATKLTRLGEKSGLVVVPKKRRTGLYVVLGVAAAAAAAVGYSLYQAFRDDEELWVAPETEAE